MSETTNCTAVLAIGHSL